MLIGVWGRDQGPLRVQGPCGRPGHYLSLGLPTTPEPPRLQRRPLLTPHHVS